MGLFRSVQAVTGASGTGPVDWTAVAEAAKASTEPGSIALSTEQQEGYADDVREARGRIREVAAIDFDVPDSIEIQNRHHWIDANIDTFQRVMAPLGEQVGLIPGLARMVNTGTMSIALAFLGNNVLGQYDPLLLAENDAHSLYFVHPNISKVAAMLDVSEPRFRRWIAFHEVSHAAEFGAAPWLADQLEADLERAVDALGEGSLDREALGSLDTTMTAVEGYAELVMDRAFDGEYADLRRKLDERRQGRGPVSQLVRRLLGLGMKRRQYERGKQFFETVADERGVEGASAVWDRPENLPTDTELDDPGAWLDRVR
ncbi:zinc-dependent metalloprotease [Halorientalis pallida]|uniref:zinc-dependent metalloprotease n=1 Tax=Halorientalis pallida TaxID=2479928 RepID=UPI003C6EF4B3